jgi:pantoate--beta-alanine ligase
MIVTDSLALLRSTVSSWRQGEQGVAFVPTMGNLHAGHLALVDLARQHADRVVVSIYVNPLQFGAGEDFEAYPRTLDADRTKLISAAVDLLILPREDEIYPSGPANHTTVEVPALSNDLCGRFRPGHFRGVATVVCKLCNWVQPDVLILGEKDYQQLVIVRRMVADLAMPMTVLGGATVREPSGLAMSSRNAYLTPEERDRAALFHQELRQAAVSITAGHRSRQEAETDCSASLKDAGFRVDYVSVRRISDLAAPSDSDQSLIILAAAWLGRTRLIDNHLVPRIANVQQQ